MDGQLLTDIEKIRDQTEIDKKKIDLILNKSKLKLLEINEHQKTLLEKEQKIMEVISKDSNNPFPRKKTCSD